MKEMKTDFEGKPLPENTTSMVVSMKDIADRADEVHKLMAGKLPFNPVTAMGFVMIGTAMLRFLGVTENTCKTIADGILETYKGVPDTGRDGKLITPEDLKDIDTEVKRCFNAPGNNTIN